MDTPTWTELEPFLDHALDTPPTEREAWLADLERTRPLIAATLRGLLRERDELDARGFLAVPLVPPVPSLAGVQVGAYTIRELIGRGGMGEVWLAERSDGRFEGRFALKFLDAYAASPAGLDRFRREGRLLARLAHEHVARLIDAGVTSSGRPYLVLEYIEGERIDRYCDAQALGVEQRVRLVLDVLAAVAHAHANLIVHRDIKPSNVLVTTAGSAKLLDFGIAKLMGPDEVGDTDAPTRLEEAALTPEYAAPEQILGEPASTATDVYQLGVLLFVLLAGRLPLAAAGGSRAERIQAALDAEPPRLSDAAPPVRRAALRGDLDAIVAKALRKRPRERYATAVALAEDLTRCLEHRPVAARADVLSYRVHRFVRRYRGAVLGTAVAALALVGVTAFALLQMREAQRQRDVSREQARRAERQSDFVTLMMSTFGERPATAAQMFATGERLLHDHFPDDPVFRVNGLINLAARYSDLGDSKKQDELIREAAVLAAPLHDAQVNARVACGLADVELAQGNLQTGRQQLDLGFDELKRVAEPDVAYVVDCLQARADFENAEGHAREALRTDLDAATRLERAGATTDVRYPSLLSAVSDLYKQLGDAHSGYEYGRRTLEAARANGQEDTDSYLTYSYNLANSLMAFGELKEGCERVRDVLARYQASGREPVPVMAAVYATCRLRFGDGAGALHWNDLALAGADRGGELSVKIFVRFTRVRALTMLKHFAEADQVVREIDALAGNAKTAPHDMLLRAQVPRADLLLAEAQLDAAQGVLDALIARLRGPDRASARILPSALLVSARLALAQRRYTDAAAAAREARSLLEGRARDPATSADVGEAALVLAQACEGLKDNAGRQQAAEQAWQVLREQLGEDNPSAQRAKGLRG